MMLKTSIDDLKSKYRI